MSTEIETAMALAADAAAGGLRMLGKRKADEYCGEAEMKMFKKFAAAKPPQSSSFLDDVAPPQTSATSVLPSTSTKPPMTNITVAVVSSIKSSTPAAMPITATPAAPSSKVTGKTKPSTMSSAGSVASSTMHSSAGGTHTRAVRLEQNRKAAKESRKRKKVMIEELQRSVIFFSRANSTLKQQNADFTNLLMQAQAQVAALNGESSKADTQQEIRDAEKAPQQETKQAPQATAAQPVASPVTLPKKEEDQQQSEAQVVATQALYQSQGYPTAAARAAAQAVSGSSKEVAKKDDVQTKSSPMPAKVSSSSAAASLPPMQPGATMQAMANFQQAAAVAMQSAMHGMQMCVPGISINQFAMLPAGANAQQAYTDTMTALAMQQAAAAQYMHPGQLIFMPHPMMAWHQQQAFAMHHHMQQQQQAQLHAAAQAQQQQQQESDKAREGDDA